MDDDTPLSDDRFVDKQPECEVSNFPIPLFKLSVFFHFFYMNIKSNFGTIPI